MLPKKGPIKGLFLWTALKKDPDLQSRSGSMQKQRKMGFYRAIAGSRTMITSWSTVWAYTLDSVS